MCSLSACPHIHTLSTVTLVIIVLTHATNTECALRCVLVGGEERRLLVTLPLLHPVYLFTQIAARIVMGGQEE